MAKFYLGSALIFDTDTDTTPATEYPFVVGALANVAGTVGQPLAPINLARAVAMPLDGTITATGLPNGVTPVDGVLTLSTAQVITSRLVTVLYAWGGRSVTRAFSLAVSALQAWVSSLTGSNLSVTATPASPSTPTGAVSGSTLSITG